MNAKIALIIPFYNVEKFIFKCATSLFSQTFEDLEFIFINDASTDRSISILQHTINQFHNRRDHVKIFHNNINIGAALSRNIGIQNTFSEYILMIDSDDFIDSDLLTELYLKAKLTKADIVVSDIIFEYYNSSSILIDEVSFDKNENIKGLLSDSKISASLCNKLIKRSLFLKCDYNNTYGLIFNEDKYLLLKLLFYSKKMVQIHSSYYHYIQFNENSVSRNKIKKHFDDMILFWDLAEQFLFNCGLINEMIETIEIAKIKQKSSFLVETHEIDLRIKYANLYHNICNKHEIKFRFGETLMLKLIDLKLFKVTQLLHNILLLKNNGAVYLNGNLVYLCKNRK